jgi:hypothetical protein
MTLEETLEEIERLGFRWSLINDQHGVYTCYAFNDALYNGGTSGFTFEPKTDKTARGAARQMLGVLNLVTHKRP